MKNELGALKKYNIFEILEGHPARTNINVFRLDGKYNVRVARVEGRFPWHRHLNGDEGWLVLQGRLRIDVEGEDSQDLRANEGTMVPRGILHSPIALEDDTVVVVFNINNFEHEFVEDQPDLREFTEWDAD